MKRRRRKIVQEKDGLSPAERLCSLLRDVQWKSNCSTETLQSFLDSLRGELGEAIRQCSAGLPRNVKMADSKMRDAVCLLLLLFTFYLYENYMHNNESQKSSTRLARNVSTYTDASGQVATKCGETRSRVILALNVAQHVLIATANQRNLWYGFLSQRD